MNTLPPIEYNTMRPTEIYPIDTDKYQTFLKIFQEYVSSDCHAILFNDELLYNTYEDKSMKATLEEHVLRNAIIEDTHFLFVHSFRKKHPARAVIYMFGDTPYFVIAEYNPELHEMSLSYYKSKQYIEKYDKTIL